MTAFHAAWALLPDGWARDVLVEADDSGTIIRVTPDAAPGAAQRLPGHAIPGVPDIHSHAFQRAMAGAAERRSPAGRDSFWTWRETMYRFVTRLTPDDAEAVAAQLHVECLEHGFTHLVEFHYLHHQPDGTPYADRAEMALRHLAAADATGIGLTLLPSLYRHGGIFGRDPNPGQRPFLNDLDGFARVMERCAEAVRTRPRANLGVAPHSLRAVTPAMLAEVAHYPGPVHIHAAEQTREVEECLAATGARPVEWLLHNAPLDRRWCLIHCTHLLRVESEGLARTGATAGLCPTTEASLGDGIFDLPTFRGAGGRIAIGTDSHVGTAPRDELRQLETSQRLRDQARSLAADDRDPHPGAALLRAVLAGGARASGTLTGAIAPGHRCDLVELDDSHPTLAGHEADALLDAWVFSGQANPVRTSVVAAESLVQDGRHRDRDVIAARYRHVIRRLLA
ncbi:formimidoylglutamate deiminase [Roseomonas sp. CCTCC AB2023176]|uniref:formimidoylglutamate deiminase n=1 Tax=Roseomonas sp. CCTCC AB2023176 TaxID=3342640 RepID=UPI0035DE9989